MFQTKTRPRKAAMRIQCAAPLLLVLALAGCGDSSRIGEEAPVEFTIAGQVSGLSIGQSVVLNNNGGDAVTVEADGPFTFPAAVALNGSYLVTVATQPAGATCTVSNGAGAGVTQDVAGITVACSASVYAISGDVSGLASGAELTLQNNGDDDLLVFANGPFAFATLVAYDGSYAVTVLAQPPGATCTVSNGTGAGVTADVSDVAVSCSADVYSIGGTVSGLGAGRQVTLFNNAADPLTLTADGSFTFPAAVSADGSYNITVGTQPVGQTCTVMNGQGSSLASNVSDVAVACSTDTFTIGGTLSGLAVSAQVTLDNNGADPLTLTGDGAFTFSVPVVHGGAYSVTVGTQPGNQACAVSNGDGTNVTADVTDIEVECIDSSYSYTTPGSHAFTVPAGVTSIEVAVTGGGGGGGGLSGVMAGGAGGAGAVVVVQLNVTPGQALSLVVGGGGGDGADGPTAAGGGYTCGASGGGGGSSNVDAGTPTQVIAGGGGGGGACGGTGDGGSGSANHTGAGGDGAANGPFSGGSGGDGGIGGAGGGDLFGPGEGGANGDGGAGGLGDDNSADYPGGASGTGTGSGTGGNASVSGSLAGAGGGGYGGGGAGSLSSGGGAGGSIGPAGSSYAPGSNGGASATAGGDGSIVIMILP